MKFTLVVASVVATLIVLNLAIVFGMYLTHHDVMYRYDSLLGWRVLPNLHAAHTPYISYTDAHGFRILPGEPVDTRECDVLMIGDSFCFGSWLSAQYTLAGRLKLAHPALRIAKAAVPGHGTDQELLALERYAPMLKRGGTVTLFTYLNDFDDIRDRWNEVREKPWFDLKGGGLVLNRPQSAVNSVLWSMRVLGVMAYAGALAFDLQPRIYGDDKYAATLYMALVERMAAIVRQRGGHFVVLYTSGRDARTINGRQWAGVAQKAAARADAEFISLDANTSALGPEMYIDGDIHWNAAGTLANYNYLAPRLDALLRSRETLLKADVISRRR
ncbi:MAG: hypothetical protein ACLQU2_10445 [Candidatus Binataceae bacterium]